ncbi:MAG: CBS domain-containing protein [Nitrospira sp.]|nr:CBS domain-containing protein [Nitrospira sp.]MCA9476706.1 CBS domain-containing protein [Nitrospira sp.]MCA9482035.1 CBS domain-containing protein [Nitrospira sp.]MCB9710929.1 CBS domain-containing protein [Nitrospiraceae bacterium]MDR4488886.1 CBS domain-containing protein [Nitrospirales bacterium]
MGNEIGNLRASKFGQLTVGSIMEKAVQSGTKDDDAKMLASYMMEGFGSIPIVDGSSKLVGIVSEFDLLKALRKGKNLDEVLAGEIMTPNPVSVTQDTNVLTLIDVLQNNHLIRVPVVDAIGKLIGIVARRDLLRGYLHVTG